MGRYKPKRKYKTKKKSLLKRRLFWDIILVFILISSIAYFLFFSQLFKIEKIEVNVQEEALKNKIQVLVENKKGSNFFLFKAREMEDNLLSEYPEIEWLKIKKVFPDNFVLNLKKREAVNIFCFSGQEAENSCSLIDKQGILFPGFFSEDLTMIFGLEKPSSETMSNILKIEKTFNEQLGIEIEKFILDDNKKIILSMVEEWEVYFDLSGDVDLALTKIKLLLEKEIFPEERKNLKYIDLRFPKAYYKWADD